MFVAGFIGSPQMNFINANLVKKDDGLYAEFGGESVLIPEGKASKPELKDYIGKEVVIGIRPEDLHDDEVFIADRPQDVVKAKVDVTEMMGAETYLYLTVGGKAFTARVNQRSTAKMGDTIDIAFDANKIHIFDKDTELTIIN